MDYRSASGRWSILDNQRRSMLTKVERLAELTVPSVCPLDEYNSQTDQLTTAWTSLGGQLVNNLLNKIMLTMFSPSRPFVRYDLTAKQKEQALSSGLKEGDITMSLSIAEKQDMAVLEQSGSRPFLYTIGQHLIVAGNVLQDSSGPTICAHPLKDYVVRRATNGLPSEMILRECVLYCDLEPEIQEYMGSDRGWRYEDDNRVTIYRWFKIQNGRWRMTTWVDDVEITKPGYVGSWSREDCPYKPLVWNLPAKQHYGVGLCEDNINDLASLDTLAKALVEGGILASQFRWMMSPTGRMRPEEFARTINGQVIPGTKEDLTLVVASIGQQLQTVQVIEQDFIKRLGAAFLMNSAITRDAERVTAEEIRLQAIELESGLGGIYSRLAVEWQGPIAVWCRKKSTVKLGKLELKPTIITGLDALSRNTDRENMLAFLGDLSQVAALTQQSPYVAARLKVDEVASFLAAGRGVDKNLFLATEQEAQQNLQAILAAQANQQTGGVNVPATGQAPGSVPTAG